MLVLLSRERSEHRHGSPLLTRLEVCTGLIRRRGDQMLELENIEVYEVYHLLIIKAYADWIDLVNTINHLVPSKMDIDPGTAVLAMVLDALSGRHSLYRIESFFKTKDTELLLGLSQRGRGSRPKAQRRRTVGIPPKGKRSHHGPAQDLVRGPAGEVEPLYGSTVVNSVHEAIAGSLFKPIDGSLRFACEIPIGERSC
jgi:hypothetical protein